MVKNGLKMEWDKKRKNVKKRFVRRKLNFGEKKFFWSGSTPLLCLLISSDTRLKNVESKSEKFTNKPLPYPSSLSISVHPTQVLFKLFYHEQQEAKVNNSLKSNCLLFTMDKHLALLHVHEKKGIFKTDIEQVHNVRPLSKQISPITMELFK